VLERGGEPVAYAAYNAPVPSFVQIGGVWTPPPRRSQGLARAAGAGALLAARERGVPRSVLFTEEDNHPAKAAYRALGYQRVGDYGMVISAAARSLTGAGPRATRAPSPPRAGSSSRGSSDPFRAPVPAQHVPDEARQFERVFRSRGG
jgi:hypothetical protein